MPGKQVSISRSKKMQPVIDEALRTFPDAQNDAQALTRALFHWFHGREENSKRGAIAALRVELAELREENRRLHQMTRELIATGDDYDTDHA